MVKKSSAANYPKPVWLKLTEEELKKIIAELAQKHPPAMIGLVLRDQYGVPTTKVYGKKLAEYLKELKIEYKKDLENVEKKTEKIKEHMKKHITDKKAKHKLQKSQSRVNSMKKYLAKRN